MPNLPKIGRDDADIADSGEFYRVIRYNQPALPPLRADVNIFAFKPQALDEEKLHVYFILSSCSFPMLGSSSQ
jgi:hypothetical protein